MTKDLKQFKQKKRLGQVMALLAVITMMVSLFGALSVELGRVYVIRNELQNAADAAALEGAAYLYPSVAGDGSPNWTLANSKALSGVTRNKVENVPLTDADVLTGYWNLTGNLSTLKPTNSTLVAGDIPAVMVTISKAEGKNGGPIKLLFGFLLLGQEDTVNLSAKAIAVCGSPNNVEPNSLFPIAMAQGLYDMYWDKINNQPKIDPNTGKSYVFKISEGPDGGWSTFATPTNDANSLINLINNGNPQSLAIGDNVWMATGVKTSVYDNVPVNKDVLVAVTAQTTPGTYQPITAFGALHIDFGVGGSGKYIQVHFIKDFKFLNSSPGGPNYGAYTSPRLAR